MTVTIQFDFLVNVSYVRTQHMTVNILWSWLIFLGFNIELIPVTVSCTVWFTLQVQFAEQSKSSMDR